MSTSFLALLPLTFLLGLKHGLDADHLAAIDAMTRHNAVDRPRLARWAGALFALGHGLVMLTVSVGVALFASQWQLPDWLLTAGVWAAIVILAWLGLLNLRSALDRSDNRAGVVGLRTGLLGRVLRTSNPLAVMGVGALFALSFDTVGQAALMAGAVQNLGGWPQAMALTVAFVSGMCLVDALNGLWTASLVRRSCGHGRIASRVMAGGVGVLGLLTAAYGVATKLSPAAEAWAEGKETWLSAGFLACVALAFAMGRVLSSRRYPAASSARSPA